MSDRPSICVIIPCYNDAEYVAGAIESVLDQSIVPDEVVIVNDGSDDASHDVISQYTTYSQVDVVSHSKNEGLPAARNTGINVTNSELIALLDADDRWVSDKIEKQLSVFENNPNVALQYSDYYLIDENGEQICVRRTRDIPDENFLRDSFTGHAAGILPSTVVMRRGPLNDVGTFDEELLLAQELDMWMRLGAKYPTYRVAEPLVKRTQRSNSLASNKTKKIEYRRDIITPKIIELYPDMKQYVDEREAFLLYERASYNASQGNTSKARRDVVRAIQKNPYLARAYIRYLSTILGPRISSYLFSILKLGKLRYRDLKHRFNSGP